MHHTDSLWAATANPLKLRPSLEGKFHTDVTIIGAGFTGLATAYYLRKAGINCVVLEKNVVGWGASGRNAGMVLTGFKNSIQQIEKSWGRETAKVFLDQSGLGIEKVRGIVEAEGIECSLSDCGSMKAAFKPSHSESMKREQEFMWQAYEYELRYVERNQLKTELDSEFYHGGLVDFKSSSFHPLNYALGLANAVEVKGGKIYEQTEVSSVEENHQGYSVKTEMGAVQSSHIVFATNGYTEKLNKKLTRSIMPMGSYIIATEPLGKEVTERLIPNNRMISDTKNFLYYFRRTPDERILFGGRVSFNSKEDETLYHSLRENLLEVFPELSDRKIEFKWGGKVAFPMDFFPHVGTIKKNIHYALGYCGHGASTSTLFGEYVAQNIIDPNREKSKLEELPLRTIPLHSQKNLLLNLAGSYYSLLDKVK
ncbi:FAD-binding oxidoreductase [Aeromicrobium ponti]|uniref:Gamma-glutamylputrescine oxidase n=1 Tax=Cytobacillus oceanisediminis TaxID=665099 RepID=A0A562K6F4_9BACI|nr:FAD-binding oxidoreductase [Cytobacillus oceanisediminis]TWH90936.1 gamma-glutamylputrescine oxidase [Cytobacillus oceanisediminis]